MRQISFNGVEEKASLASDSCQLIIVNPQIFASFQFDLHLNRIATGRNVVFIFRANCLLIVTYKTGGVKQQLLCEYYNYSGTYFSPKRSILQYSRTLLGTRSSMTKFHQLISFSRIRRQKVAFFHWSYFKYPRYGACIQA